MILRKVTPIAEIALALTRAGVRSFFHRAESPPLCGLYLSRYRPEDRNDRYSVLRSRGGVRGEARMRTKVAADLLS